MKIYVETIRQLIIDKEALATEVAKASGVTRLHPQQRGYDGFDPEPKWNRHSQQRLDHS